MEEYLCMWGLLMSEQRFTIQNASGMYLHLPIFDNGVEMADGDVCILLNEQQATIRKLQDLCGESDGENMKLRNEIKLLKPTNIEQYEQIVQLQKENEQLRKELNDFKPVMFQDIRGTVILYSKGGIDE